MKPHMERPDLTIYGLHYCDRCGEPLISGETRCGQCRAWRAVPPLRPRAPRAPRRRHGRQDPWKRVTGGWFPADHP